MKFCGFVVRWGSGGEYWVGAWMATVAFFGACARLVLFVYLGERAPDGQDGVGRHGARRAQIPHGAQPRDAVALKGGGVGARALVDEDDREPRERGALVYVCGSVVE